MKTCSNACLSALTKPFDRSALALVLVMLTVGCEGEAPPEEALRPVRTLSIEPGLPMGERVIPGRLEASANRRLSFRLDGRLDGYEVAVGDRVSAGQVLARLEDIDYRLRRDQAGASLAAANAASINAEAEWQRARRLYEAGSVPARQLDAARAQVDSARAQRQSAERQVELAERQVGFATLEASDDCRVAQRLAEVGENVGAGQPVLVLACGEGMEVRASLSEDLLALVGEGESVDVRLPLLDATLPGRVDEIGLPLQPPQATWPLRVSIDIADAEREGIALVSGMAAEIRLSRTLGDDEGLERGLWVPMPAVGEDGSGHFVYVAVPDGEADANGRRVANVERRSIVLGRRQGESLEVRDGLEAGDRLVIAGMSRIRDGQRVRLEAGR